MLPKSIQNLIDEFSRLPGIGSKTAARLVFYLLSKPKSEVDSIGEAFLNLSKNIKYCRNCYNITENDLCSICQNQERNNKIVCVVEDPLDVLALEKSGGFNGVYHVLGGAISPIDGIGPEQLRINQLIERINNDGISEIVLATNPNLEGEATAAYLKDQIIATEKNIRITRIARGIPMGGDLEYADEDTLKRSLEGRKKYI